MTFVKTEDGTNLYVRDWGRGKPVVLIHGWPLSGDSWEAQAVSLAEAGFRVVSYDRRGFGKSDQPYGGYDYDTFADDLAEVMTELGLEDVALVGFSMGGGEIARYMSRHGGRGVSRAVLVSAVTPYMLRTPDRDVGVTMEDIDGIKEGLRKDRPAFLQDFFKAFYGNGLLGGGASKGVLDWSFMMAMQASPKATLDCVTAFGTTDFRKDMAAFRVPTLVIHGTDDKTVPIDATGREAGQMIAGAELIEYEGAAHGITVTHADRLTQDLLDFLRN